MIPIPRPTRRSGLLALVAVLLASAVTPSGAAAQRAGRRATFLSDREAPRDECRASQRPGRLPALGALADSAALVAGLEQLAAEHRLTEDTTFVLFTLWFDDEGTPQRIQHLEYYLPASMLEPLRALVARTLKPQDGRGYLRMRLHPGTRRVLVGRAEVCRPLGPERMRVQRDATLVRESYRPVRARILVSPEGMALRADKLRSSGDEWIDNFVLDWVQRTRYTPGLVDGIPAELEFEHDIRVTQ